jgi:adenine phosphoribosyltransferase
VKVFFLTVVKGQASMAVAVADHYYVLDPDSAVARRIASSLTWYSPRFSPKDVPKFYDISSITENPGLFGEVVDTIVQRYKALGRNGPTHILGFDARGFLLGTPVALGLGIPFVMMRKAEKSPGVLIKSRPYHKEYAEDHPDTMAIRRDALHPGDRVVLIDDLIATGGTAVSGFQLVEACGAEIIEFCAVIGIPFLGGVDRIHSEGSGRWKNVPIFTLVHDSSIGDETCGDPKEFPEGSSRIQPV